MCWLIELIKMDFAADPSGMMFLCCLGGPAGILILWFFGHLLLGDHQDKESVSDGHLPVPMPLPIARGEHRPRRRY